MWLKEQKDAGWSSTFNSRDAKSQSANVRWVKHHFQEENKLRTSRKKTNNGGNIF